jgi:hypothetical protein
MRKETIMKKYIAALALLLGFVEPALAQWQVPDHAVPIGRGPGFTGFKNAAPGAAGTALTSRGTAVDPAFIAPGGGTSVLAFAVGDCVTDDSTAIQNAINSLSPNGGTIYFPPAPGGCYAIGAATAITFPTSYAVALVGAGRGSIESHAGTLLKATASISSMIKTSTTVFSRGHRISNMTWDGDNKAAICLQIDLLGSSTFDHLDIINCTTANFRLGTTGLNAIENTLFDIRLDNPLNSHPPAVLPAHNLDIWSTNNFISSILAINASNANIRTRSGASFNNQFNAVHGYNFDYTSVVPSAASVNNFLIEGGGDQFVNWEADGSSSANVQINGFQNILSNGISLFPAPLTAQKGIQFGDATCFNQVTNNALFDSSDVNSIVQAGTACGLGNYYTFNANGTTGTPLGKTLYSGVNGSVSGNLTLFGSTSGNAQIVPPAAAGTPTLTLPTSTGTLTESSVSTYATNGLLYGTGTSTLTNADRCMMDSTQGISCTSATTFQPQWNILNSTADAGNPVVRLAKTRTGGNTNSGDGFGQILFNGFANSASQIAVEIHASQVAASSGSNIPSKIEVSTSNTSGLLNQIWTFNEKGHMAITASAAPTLTAGCSGAGNAITGNNVHGTATGQTAAATTCTLTFANGGFTATPDCVVSGLSSPLTGAITPSTTTLVVNFASTANYKFTWHCFGL